MNQKNTHGGARPGAGRKAANGKMKATLTIRIDSSLLQKARDKHGQSLGRLIREYLKSIL